MRAAADPILTIRDLSVCIATDEGEHEALDRVSFSLGRNQILGLAGESGCGKSITALSILRLLPQPAGRITGGSICFDGQDLLTAPEEDLYPIRGGRISMIFQEPMTALNPVKQIGKQLAEVYALHFPAMSAAEAKAAGIRLLTQVGIPAARRRMREYPHQLSGGMRQRVMIAMALAPRPDILIADEPTTALDVTIQGQILALLQGLQAESGLSILFITHDLSVIANLCDEVVVMYAGRVVEQAATPALFSAPKHPYTRGLLQAMPRLETRAKSVLKTIEGIVPAPGQFPAGCRFQARCALKKSLDKDRAQAECERINPPLQAISAEQQVACLHWRQQR